VFPPCKTCKQIDWKPCQIPAQRSKGPEKRIEQEREREGKGNAREIEGISKD
jgi:hypothetical protein